MTYPDDETGFKGSEPCPYCNGSGEVVDSVTCEGIWHKDCPPCDGTGVKQ